MGHGERLGIGEGSVLGTGENRGNSACNQQVQYFHFASMIAGNEPLLDAPGAGIPALERWSARALISRGMRATPVR